MAPETKYLLVQPHADGQHRFERATVISTHQTEDGAFAALARYGSRLDGFGIRPDAIELLAVPMGGSTERFLQMVQYSLPNTNPTLTASPDDIVFYREVVTVPLK